MPSVFHRLFAAEDEETRLEPVKAAETGTERLAAKPAVGLIRAEELPPAGDALAELFAEAPPSGEESPALAVTNAETEASAQQPVGNSVNQQPKRRNIFLRLFSPKQVPDVHSSPDQGNTTKPVGGNAAVEIAIAIPAEGAEPAVSEAPAAALRADGPIPSHELPPAADALEALFAPEPVPAQLPSEDTTVSPPDEVRVVWPAPAEKGLPSTQAVGGEARNKIVSEQIAAVASASATATGAAPAAVNEHAIHAQSPSSEIPAGPPTVETASKALAEPTGSEIRPAAQIANTTASEPDHKPYRDWALDDKLASHREWVESHGVSGKRADLSGAELEAADLISVNLRLADLHDANLRAADLLLADLRDACLVRADLEESCLVGANLEGANLEGASLETAMGLVPRQFAGANLHDALLAPQLMEFEAVGRFTRSALHAYRYFYAMTVLSVLAWLVVWKTRDAQLVTDSAIVPFLRSRAAAAALPTAESYLIVPVVLLIAYLIFHFHLQRLWDSVLELPAVFPEGHILGEGQPGIIQGLLRTHFRWMNPDPPATRLVERILSLLLAYWVVPATLLLFWARYLTRQEIHGTILQALLTVVAAGIAMHATTKVGKPQQRWAVEKTWAQRLFKNLKAISPLTVGIIFGIALILASAGTIFGVPHERARAPQYGAASLRRWAPTIFSWLGFDPYPDLTEASVSTRPRGWDVSDDEVATVDGARLNKARIRYAQGYGAFFANAHLWQADLQGAFLSQADLRGADLGQSNLRFAVLDQARLYHANLDRSNLAGADLQRADLRNANLSYSSLAGAILVDAKLDGASLYAARLDGSTGTRADLEKVDLRNANLENAHLDHADLQGAYLWSAELPGADLGGAQLESAILIEANLHGANLGGAQLTGTVLNNADLSGTSLEGADLRGALGLTATQICSARSRRGALLDPEMQIQVDAQCAAAR